MLQGTRPMACPHVIALAQGKERVARAATRLRERSQSRRGSFLLRSRVPPLLMSGYQP